MYHLRNLKTLLGAFVLAANAQGQTVGKTTMHYAQDPLSQIYSQEQLEQRKADELEQKAVQKRGMYEKQKYETEKQIATHQFQIEGLKMRQEKALNELDAIAADLQHVNSDLSSYQAEHKQLDDSSKATIEYLKQQRTDLLSQQKAADKEFAVLTETRKKAEREIYNMSVEIQRYKTDLAKTETRVEEAEMARAELEADEMRVRNDWMQMKAAVAEHHQQRDEALAQLAEAKAHFAQANKEMQQAKLELGKAEKDHADTTRRVQAEVVKLERDIQQADNSREATEAKRARLESEAAALLDRASATKEKRDQAVDAQNASESLVLKSSLALETARATVDRKVETQEQSTFKAEKKKHRERGLAAAEEASQNLVDGGRLWITTESCKAYKAANTGTPAGFFESGKQLMAKDHGKTWMEVVNVTGASVFIEKHCGKYQN